MDAAKQIVFRYGSHTHAVGECVVKETKESRTSEDGDAILFTTCRWDILGTLIRDSQSAITQAVNAIRVAYSRGGQDAGLYFLGGGATAIVVRSGSTVSGVRVARPPHFPDAAGGQYSTFLHYAIALEWEEAGDTGLVSRRQSIEYEGEGGADWEMVTPVIGAPLSTQRTEQTPVIVRQSGIAIGCGGNYQLPSVPIWDAIPPRIPSATKIAFRDIPGPSRERETTWSYVFQFPSRPAFIRP